MLAVADFAPRDADVQIVLGVLYNVSLDYESAEECFRRAIEIKSEDYTLYNKVR
jgi:peroxin-5